MRPLLGLAFACLLAASASAQPKDRPDPPQAAGRPVAQASGAAAGQLPEKSKASGTSAEQCLGLVRPRTTYGSWCDSLHDCVKFCRCACDFDITKWDKNSRDDGVASCRFFPRTAKRVIPSDSADLERLTTSYQYIDVDASDGIHATQSVLDALARLDAQLATSRARREHDYRFRVSSCYRSAHSDSQPECGFVYKGQYEVDRSTWGGAAKTWTWLGNPNNLGLAWPGASPHSAGVACDLILEDSRGRDCFDWRAGVVAKKGQTPVPTCSIAAREAVRYAVDELTSASVGARRLDYEAWHFEWDPESPSSRCGSREECDKHWPLLGHP